MISTIMQQDGSSVDHYIILIDNIFVYVDVNYK
jgi:hypothetical protein